MPRQRIDTVGKGGLNTDVHATMLPPQVWTTLHNVQTNDGSLRSSNGRFKLFNLGIRPQYHTTHVDRGASIIVVSDGARVLAYKMDGTHTDITPGTSDWGGGEVTFANLNGVLVVNSVTNGPFYWTGGTAKLVALPGWDMAKWRCRVICAYRYYLVALNMTEDFGSSTDIQHYPHKIRWSNSAAEGEVPALWVPALTNDAGDDLLGESQGEIVTGFLWRDGLAIIKEDAVYQLQWVGGQYVMQTTRLKGGLGAPVRGYAAELRGSVALFSTTDLRVFDGQQSVSLIDGRVREGILGKLSPDYYDKAIIFVHYALNRLIVAGAKSGDPRLVHTWIYDWEEDAWHYRPVHYGYGFDEAAVKAVVTPGGWNDLAGAEGTPPPFDNFIKGADWDAQRKGPWNAGTYSPSFPDLLVYESNPADTAWWVSVNARTYTDSESHPLFCQAERIGLPIEGADGLAMVTEVWLEMAGSIPVKVWVGGQASDYSTPTWDGPFTVNPDYERSITPRVTGRYVAIRLESEADGFWELASLTIHHERAGER